MVAIAGNEQGFVQYGKSGNKSSALAHSQIEKQMLRTCTSAHIAQNPLLCVVVGAN